jgi:molecular chaperone HtpG
VNEIERIPFQIEINRVLEVLAKQIYPSPIALLRENCQNAYDAILQRRHMGQGFAPEINVTLSPTEICITDNGIGMTRQELIDHYWKAGSSGKNNSEARAAGVVGTFGIGAMANFGVADTLIVTSESAKNGERTKCIAVRDKLSVTENCIDMTYEHPTGQPGTMINAKILPSTSIDVNAATSYIADIVRHLEIPVLANGNLISKEPFENSVPRLQPEWHDTVKDVALSPQIVADIELVIAKTGEIWLSIQNMRYDGNPLKGLILLRQGMHNIKTFRSMFALATVAVSSAYGLGGIVNLDVLEQTAGREALTTSSLQILQSIITECETYISRKIALTQLADMNTNFMQWVRMVNLNSARNC